MLRGAAARSRVKKAKAAAAEQMKQITSLFAKIDKGLEDVCAVSVSLKEEDDLRPADFWKKKEVEILTLPQLSNPTPPNPNPNRTTT